MLELIWRFRGATLADDAVMHELMLALSQIPGFAPADYDLNQKEQWRPFSLERAVVDALTQRTQLVRLRGEEGQALAMIALGKRHEQPTAIVRLPEQPELQPDLRPLVDQWTSLYEALPLESTLISSATWRRQLGEAGLFGDVADGLLGMVYGWRRGAQPQGLSEIDAEVVADTPVELYREVNHLVLRLGDGSGVVDPAHERALEYVARRLLQGLG
jgi:hypothetical protein